MFWTENPPDPRALLEHADYAPWAEFARWLTDSERTRPAEQFVLMGPGNKQQDLKSASRTAIRLTKTSANLIYYSHYNID
ncbi:hypothetical protein JCM18750_30160 [Halostagnicola bangensis]